jgi:hypothetical protein
MPVSQLDDVQRRALVAGASEVEAPEDYEWKPPSSVIDDPTGNHIQLSLA